MKTETLIDLLARNAGPAPRGVAARRLTPAALGGLLLAASLAAAVLGTVPAALFATPAPWVKLAYAGTLALAAAWLVARLSRPAAPCDAPLHATLTVLLGMAVVAALMWMSAPAPDRLPALLGHSWAACPWNVLGLSLPALGATLWALRGLAPTRPRAAGAAAGLLAGAVAAFGYAFACDETSLTFVAVWYTLGIALSTALGALAGPRVLRW